MYQEKKCILDQLDWACCTCIEKKELKNYTLRFVFFRPKLCRGRERIHWGVHPTTRSKFAPFKGLFFGLTLFKFVDVKLNPFSRGFFFKIKVLDLTDSSLDNDCCDFLTPEIFPRLRVLKLDMTHLDSSGVIDSLLMTLGRSSLVIKAKTKRTFHN